jgi:uncharacterized C2H2 Zn-finger protein
MPRITAFMTDKGISLSAIPTKVYQCPFTKKIFKRKIEYIKHLKNRREKTYGTINWNKQKARLKLCGSFYDIAELIPTLNYKEYGINVLYVQFEATRWSRNCSNTHCSPMGKPRNFFNADPNLPTGYPGWRGRIMWEQQEQISRSRFSFSSFLNDLDIHALSGGSGDGIHYAMDFIMFAEEWEVFCAMEKLKGNIPFD